MQCYKQDCTTVKRMDYAIRKAVLSDAESINKLFKQMLRSIYQREDVQGYDDGYLDKYFCTEDNLIYVAEAGSHIIAFLSIEEHLENGAFIYLDDFCVDEIWRGHGIGTKLLEMAMQYAIEHHFHEIELHVEAGNTRALKLYKRMGYEEYQSENGRIKMVKHI